MKLLYFRSGGQLRPGISTSNGVVDVDAYLSANGRKPLSQRNLSVADLPLLSDIEAGVNAGAGAAGSPGAGGAIGSSGAGGAAGGPEFLLPEKGLEIGPCVPYSSKIICIGLNYRKHAVESGMAVPTVPVVFTKYANTLVDYGGDVPLGEVGTQFDYEVELGVVIGARCKNVKAAHALDYVMGYCVANDLSCRDLQFRTSQWLMGKSLDHFLPLGKCLVTRDEIPDPQKLRLRCTLNGQIRQDSNTSDMVFSVAEIIEDLSRHMTLEPGDLILTGTPEGVIMGLAEKDWLKPGDVVVVEIGGLGSTGNRMS